MMLTAVYVPHSVPIGGLNGKGQINRIKWDDSINKSNLLTNDSVDV